MKNKFKFGRFLLATILAVGMIVPSNMVLAEDEKLPVVNETKEEENKKEETKEPVVEVVKVTFKLEEGAAEKQNFEPVEVKKGEKLVKVAAPNAKEGYKFVAWYLGDKAFDFETILDKDIELVAKFEKVETINDLREKAIKAVEKLENLSELRFNEYVKEIMLANEAELKVILAKANDEDSYKARAIAKLKSFPNLTEEVVKDLTKEIKNALSEKKTAEIIEQAKDIEEASEDIKLDTEIKFDKKDVKKAVLQVVTDKPEKDTKVKVKVTSLSKDVKLDYEKEVDKDGKVEFDIERAKEDYRINVRVILEQKDKYTLNKNKSVKVANYEAAMLEFETSDYELSRSDYNKHEFAFIIKDAPSKMEIKVNDEKADFKTVGDKKENAKATVTLRNIDDKDELKITIKAEGYKDYEKKVKVADLIKFKEFKKYILGYPDGTFGPSNTITRAEAASMFARLERGSIASSSLGSFFKDVHNEWFAEDVNYVAQKGYMDGYPGGYFKPNENMTREQFAQMISVYIQKNVEKLKDSDSVVLKDVDRKHWSANAIQEAIDRGIIDGYGDSTFRGSQDITRAEAVKILNRVFGRVTTEKSLTNEVNVYKLVTFKDVNTSHWAFYEILDASNTHSVNVLDNLQTWTR